MKRGVLAVAVSLAFATTILAENGNPAEPKPEPSAQAAQQQQDNVRKLSRRERKDRIAKLDERFRKFLTDVDPIILPQEIDAFLVLETNAQRDVFIDDFWKRRDQAQGTSNRAFRDLYYARLEEARERFEQVSSDRSRMFLLYGEPASIVRTDCSRLLQPLEIWQYLYLSGMGSRVYLVFYQPRTSRDYKLWSPMAGDMALAELVSVEAMGQSMGQDEAVRKVFFSSASPYSFVSRIRNECANGDVIQSAIMQMQANKIALLKVYDPPAVNEEDVTRVVRNVVIANPNAPKLTAEFAAKFPGKDGSRTDTQITLLVPRAQLATKDVAGTSMYSLDVVGEVLRNEQLWEKYRYRFDFPADVKDEKLPIVINRLLRPQDYQSRIKIVDVHSGAEVVLENTIDVPEIFDSAESRAAQKTADATISELKQIVSGAASLRIVPMPQEEVLSGIQTIETIASGEAIKAVEFWLDGKKIAVRRSPPFSLDLDFGTIPQMRRIRAIALDANNQPITGDDIVVNTGTEPFRVRIASPRVAPNLQGPARVAVDVRVPDGKELEAVELYWNETKVATMYDPPFVHTVNVPAGDGGVGYFRAVAKLKDDSVAPIEDVVMINSPAHMEEINVHLVELPTTVTVGGKPVNDLQQTAFKVLDEGKPVQLTKFEYVKNLPLSIGMAVDTSGSMTPRMEETQKAGAQFLARTMRKGDKAFLVAFDSQPQMVQKWSPHVADIHAGLAKLRAEDYTSLYDAIVYSLYNFLGVKGQKALVVLSDGKDTSSKFTFDQALEYARRSAVPIYAIGIGIKTADVDVRSKLSRLATETGGNTYFIENAAGLTRIYDDIQNELRSQYVLGFYPPADVKPGSKWREVTVQVSNGKAKTIRGYYP